VQFAVYNIINGLVAQQDKFVSGLAFSEQLKQQARWWRARSPCLLHVDMLGSGLGTSGLAV
jgi:hypothetical protein